MTLHGPVLVGTDLSAAAEEALRQGAQLANGLNSTLFVCHVIPELLPDITLFAEFRRAHGQVEQSVLIKARHAVQEQLDAVLKTHGATLEVALEYGTPHVGLLSAAEKKGAGVIVVGPGSTALDVVRHAPGAVLVARRSTHGPVVGATDFSDPALPALQVAASEARRRNTAHTPPTAAGLRISSIGSSWRHDRISSGSRTSRTWRPGVGSYTWRS